MPDEQESKPYCIANDNHADLFWSNSAGWVAFDDCDRFTEAETLALNLPTGGMWAEICG